MKIHRGERPYKCECSKAFTQKSDLDYHLLNHFGERRCAASVENSFGKKSHLDGQDMKVHRSDLNKHVKVHKKNQETVNSGQ